MTEDTTTDDGTDTLTPADVREGAQALLPTDGTVEDAADAETPFTALLAPETRVRIIGALLEAGGEPLSVARLCEIAGVSKASFARHKTALLTVGVMREADKVGNAQRYALDVDHPAAQVLAMLDNVLTWGQTPELLEEQFIGEPGE